MLELKLQGRRCGKEMYQSLNRTMLELKLQGRRCGKEMYQSLNRTMLELKHNQSGSLPISF